MYSIRFISKKLEMYVSEIPSQLALDSCEPSSMKNYVSGMFQKNFHYSSQISPIALNIMKTRPKRTLGWKRLAQTEFFIMSFLCFKFLCPLICKNNLVYLPLISLKNANTLMIAFGISSPIISTAVFTRHQHLTYLFNPTL